VRKSGGKGREERFGNRHLGQKKSSIKVVVKEGMVVEEIRAIEANYFAQRQ
jgi:hypothetical protein